MIYLPNIPSNEQCVVIIDDRVIRVYDHLPTSNSSVGFTDYFYNSHYSSISGFVEYESESPTCIALEDITDNVFYRNDISDILLSFTCIFFVTMSIIVFVCKSFFKGLFK